MLGTSRLLAACAFLVGILLGASVCGAGPPGPLAAESRYAGSSSPLKAVTVSR